MPTLLLPQSQLMYVSEYCEHWMGASPWIWFDVLHFAQCTSTSQHPKRVCEFSLSSFASRIDAFIINDLYAVMCERIRSQTKAKARWKREKETELQLWIWVSMCARARVYSYVSVHTVHAQTISFEIDGRHIPGKMYAQLYIYYWVCVRVSVCV